MADTRRRAAPPGPAAPSFEVQIQRGHRAALEPPSPDEMRPAAPLKPLSPVAERRARTRRRARRALATLVAVGLLAVGIVWWLGQPPADALARVNGEYITAAQVDREILLNRALSGLANNGQVVADTRTATLERLISERMLAQAIARAGMSLPDADLDAALDRVITGQQWTAAQVESALARQGLARTDLRASIRNRVLINRYLDAVVDQGAPDAGEASARENTWRTQVEGASQVERYGNPEAEEAPDPGRSAPDFTLHDLDGQSVSLAGLRGRPVMVNFWATWCAPCRIEMPALITAYRQAHAAAGDGQGFALLAVAINSAPDTVQAFRREFGMTFPVLLDTDSQVVTLYRVGPIPTSFLIDREGIVRWVQVGTWTEALLQDKLHLIEKGP